MLFNSYAFILIFLPVTIGGYFAWRRFSPAAGRWYLIAACLTYMGLWSISFALALWASVLINFVLSRAMMIVEGEKKRKLLLWVAIIFNVFYLGSFKYANFFLENLSLLVGMAYLPIKLFIPLGISFYTFMQIAWLVQTFRRENPRTDFVSHVLYITFFPYVISGPIAYPSEVVPQFHDDRRLRFCFDEFNRGLFLFSLGLFKKVAVADTLGHIADGGFSATGMLTLTEAWITSLSFTLQLYFDFSGYTDMALGIARAFGIKLPPNFNSPLKALDVRDFWRRWHMTLSRFLRDFIYIPLGGNRRGLVRTLVNIMVTFLICGLWHGAQWTFVFWGFLHGVALGINRLWHQIGLRLPKVLAWFLTFNFVNAAFVFFRAPDMKTAFNILLGMIGQNGFLISPNLEGTSLGSILTSLGARFGEWRIHLPLAETMEYFFCFLLLPIVLWARNSNEREARFQFSWKTALLVALLFSVGLLYLNQSQSFVYFNF